MDRSHEIAAFVRRFLALHGAGLRENDAGVLEAELPDSLARELGVTTGRICVAFDPPGEGEARDAEYLTFGHPLLDRMLDMARARGRATSLIVPHGLDMEFLEGAFALDVFDAGARAMRERTATQGLAAPARELQRRIDALRFQDLKVRVLETRVVYHAQVMFFFKVSFLSDEKRERVVSLLIDPYTEEIDRPVDLRRAVRFHVDCGKDKSQEEYALQRLYRRACDHLERRLARAVEEYERAVGERLRKEERRIEEYYAGLIQERVEPLRKLFRKMAVASVRADLARSWSTENRYREAFAELKQESRKLEEECERDLAELQAEKGRRIQEVREKHQGRVEVTLTHAALVRVPRVEWRVHLAGRARREISILYDVLRRRLVDWECESCTARLGDVVHLCDCEAVVCAGCFRLCPGCGKASCRACAQAICHVCGGPVCPHCSPSCPAGLKLAAGYPVCVECSVSHCPWCISLVGRADGSW